MAFGAKIGKGLLIFFVFLISLTVIFWPILFGGKVINDFAGLGYAHYKFLSDFGEGLGQGHLRLWWNNYLSGFPVYLTQTGFFNPLIFIFYKIFVGFELYNWLTFFNFLLGGLSMYWLARNLPLSIISSAVAGLSYMLSQNHFYWGPTIPFTNVFPFIPLFFLAVLKISNGRRLWWLWGSLISAYGLAAGETQIVFYTFAVGFFWAVFLSYFHNFKAVFGYLWFAVSGAILASFWILPVLNYLKFTVRSSALNFKDLPYDFMHIADPLRFFYPYIQFPQFTGLASLGLIGNYYIGALTILLAVAAVFLIKKNSAQGGSASGGKLVAFWAGVAVFSLLVRIKWTGIFWLMHFLPVFDRFRGVFHWSYMGGFALALLAGLALHNMEQIKNSPYFKKFVGTLKIFCWANIAAFAGVFFVSLFRNQILAGIFKFFDAKIYLRTRQFPIEHYHNVIISELDKFLNAFSLSNYHFVVSFFSVLAAILIFVLYQKEKINFNGFKKMALVFTFLNLTLIWQGYYEFIPQSKIINYPDTVSFIKNHYPKEERYRLFRFYPPESYQKFEVFSVKNWADYQLKTMESNIGVYFDMDTFGGLEPFLSGRIADVFNEIGLEIPTSLSGEPWLRSTKLTLDEKIKIFSSSEHRNLLSMLNIKYILSSFKFPRLNDTVGQANLKLVYETIATEKNIPVYVYENPEVMPRIYFAKNVKYVNSENAFEELLKVKDFHTLTIIESSNDKFPMSNQVQNPNVKDKIQIQEFKPELVKIKTSGSGWLVYSDANLPTWEAYIDGQITSIYTANYLFKSVFVPGGEHEVIFKYPNLWGQYKAAIKDITGNR